MEVSEYLRGVFRYKKLNTHGIVQSKICRLQPIDGILNMLLGRD